MVLDQLSAYLEHEAARLERTREIKITGGKLYKVIITQEGHWLPYGVDFETVGGETIRVKFRGWLEPGEILYGS